MTLRQLAYFLKVVETGSMTRAAERLNVAQPALGVQIRQLEEELGVALLTRHARGIETTAAGALLVERAREVLGLVERTRREVAAAGGDTAEPVRLGLTPSLMHIIGTEIALLARERPPLAALSLLEEMSHKLVEALQRGDLEMALACEVQELPGITRRALYQEDLVLVGQPGPQDGEAVPFAEAVSCDLAMPEPRDSVRTLVAQTARGLGLGLR